MKSLLALLALSVAAGLVGVSMGDNHDIPPISVDTDKDSLVGGESLTLTGMIKNINTELMGAVTIQIIDPDGGISGIQQVLPAADGSFSVTIPVGGPLWMSDGEYTIRVVYINDEVTLPITYAAPAPEPEPEPEPVPEPEPEPVCGPGTELVDGVCQITQPVVEEEPEIPPPPPVEEPEDAPLVCGPGTELVGDTCRPVSGGGGCLIATAAFGTEMAPQVQYLREVRDNTVMSTSAGTSFMSGFNSLYYMVSPTIADMERENPLFRDAVRLAITPMLGSLSIMELAEDGSEISVLATGILVIALNALMYLVAPTVLGFKAYRQVSGRISWRGPAQSM